MTTDKSPDRRRLGTFEEVELVELRPRFAGIVVGHVSLDGIADFLGSAFGEVLSVLVEQGLDPAGPPFGRWNPRGDGFDAEAGFPTSSPVSPAGRVQSRILHGGLAATARHRGDFAAIVGTCDAINEWILRNGYAATGQPPWASYLDESGVPEPRTQVYMPCAEAPRR